MKISKEGMENLRKTGKANYKYLEEYYKTHPRININPLIGEKHHNWSGKYLEKNCLQCGNIFKPKSRNGQPTKLCSRSCADEWKSENIKTFLGKHHIIEAKEKMRKAKLLNPPDYWKHHKKSKEHIEKFRQSLKEGYASGRIVHWSIGKKRPDASLRMLNGGAAKAKIAANKKYTKPELFVKSILDKCGLQEGLFYKYDCVLKTNNGYRFPDFRLLYKKEIIEADGIYWHKNKIKEAIRDAEIREQGYKINHISEDLILRNPQETIKQIIDII